MTLVFIMVGKNDKPVFELDLTDKAPSCLCSFLGFIYLKN
jgi:hypothetical protein